MDFTRPQRVFKNEKGEDQVINVSVAQHPQIRFGDSVLYGETTNRGRAFHNGENDKSEGAILYGYNFSEQFDRAIETDPPVVLVTGWNEWIAGRWQGIPERPIMFVDCCNCEYSRDLEMMRGGYFDNYFMQFISYVRKYKGFAPIPAHAEGEAAVYDLPDDGAFARDNDGYGTRYVNKTGRNTIVRIDAVRKGGKISFTIKAKDALQGKDEGDFMVLFIKTEKGTFLASGDKLYSLSDGFERTPAADIVRKITEKAVTYEIPLEALGAEKDILFKAADSTEKYTSVEDFYDKGDVAPLGRPCFIYRMK